MELSKIIIKNLIINDEYTKRVLAFLKSEYFEVESERIIFETINDFVEKYSGNPTFESLYIDLSNKNLNEKIFDDIDSALKEIKTDNDTSKIEWLIEKTEDFCKKRAIHNALMQSISIFDGTDKKHDVGAIPAILEGALGVGFDTSVGHDYIENAEDRYEYYHRKEEKISTGINVVDEITGGGFANKTFNLYLAGPHVGKTAIMCYSAAHNLMDGKNVLYLTLEIAEYEIAKRIDANLLDVGMENILSINKEMFMNKILNLKKKSIGKLKVRQYPTGMANVLHFKQFLNELRLKKGFIPHIIYVDYLNICASSRVKVSTSMTSYTYFKFVSEELRGLGIECDLPVVSATQFNRTGAVDTNPEMDSISESFAVNFTSDFTLALVTSEDLKLKNQLLGKQLKNRYQDMNKKPKFFLGNDRDKMRFFDVGNESQQNSGSNIIFPTQFENKNENNFDGFKF